MEFKNKIAIIDIGSNSVRLVIYGITLNKSFVILEDIKETIRLGQGINDKQELSEEKIKLALKTMQLYKKVCVKNNVDEIIAFATAALRIATNSAEVLKEIFDTTGIDVRVFSGEEEALSSFTGAINTLDISDGVVIDLGGSSMEVVYFLNREPLERISLNFGAVTLSEIVNLKDRLNGDDEKKIRAFIRKELDKVLWKEKLENLNLIGVGGTIRNISAIHLYKNRYPLKVLHNYKVNAKEVTEVVNFVKRKDYVEKLEIEGLSKARADVFVGAAIAVEEVINYFRLKGLITSNYGIREGVLYKRLTESGKIVVDPFDEGIKELADILEIDVERKEKYYQILNKIFLFFSEKYSFDLINNKILKVISYFFDIGKNISYENYFVHSGYMTLNLRMKGIEQKDLIASALIVAKTNEKSNSFKEYKNIFSEKELTEIIMLSKIVEITTMFTHKLLLDKESFEIDINNDETIFYIKGNDEYDLKIINLFISQKKFFNIFNKKIKFKLEVQ